MKMNNKGFSLVELIIVIAIMAILAGALAPALIKYIAKSRRSSDVNNAGTIQSSMQTALSDENAGAKAPYGTEKWTAVPNGKNIPSAEKEYWEAVDNDLSGGLAAFMNLKTTKFAKRDTTGDTAEACKVKSGGLEYVYQMSSNDQVFIGIHVKTDANPSVDAYKDKVFMVIPKLDKAFDGKDDVMQGVGDKAATAVETAADKTPET